MSVSGATPMEVSGIWLVYLASETLTGGGTDLNGDADITDEIAVAVRGARRVFAR